MSAYIRDGLKMIFKWLRLSLGCFENDFGQGLLIAWTKCETLALRKFGKSEMAIVFNLLL